MPIGVMAQKGGNGQIGYVSGEWKRKQSGGQNSKTTTISQSDFQSKTLDPTQLKEKTKMKKLFTSSVLTLAAVPFLMAAPHAAKKAQNQAPSSDSTATATKKVHKKKMKKSGNGTASTQSSTTSTSTSQK
jgi:hypothetical protein